MIRKAILVETARLLWWLSARLEKAGCRLFVHSLRSPRAPLFRRAGKA